MLTFTQFTTLMESFKDAKTKWLKQGDVNDINDSIETFKYLKTRGIIPKSQDDIGYWIKKNFSDFKFNIQVFQNEADKKDCIDKWNKEKGTDYVSQHISKFNDLVDDGIVSGKESMFGFWKEKSLSQFVDFINSKEKSKESTSLLAGVPKNEYDIFSDNQYATVVVPKTYNASNALGCPSWCVVYSTKYWNDYVYGDGYTFYYVLWKQPALNFLENLENLNLDLSNLAFRVDIDDRIQDIWETENKKSIDLNTEFYNKDDENEEDQKVYTLEDILNMFDIEYWNFESYLTESDEDPEVDADKEWIIDYFDDLENFSGVRDSIPNRTTLGKLVDELYEYYDEKNIDTDDRIAPNQISRFLQIEFDKGKFDSASYNHSNFMSDFSDFIKRTIQYPESKYLSYIIEDLNKHLKSRYDDAVKVARSESGEYEFR